MKKNYKLISTVEDCKFLSDLIESHDIISFDTETDSLNPRKGTIIGFSISTKPNEGFYLATHEWNDQTKLLEPLKIDRWSAYELARKLVGKLVGKKLIMHNGSFDIQFVRNYYGVDLLSSLYVDTTILVHTVNEEGAWGYNKPFALKCLAQFHSTDIGFTEEDLANQEQEDLKKNIRSKGGSTKDGEMELYKADLDYIWKYACADTDLTFRLYEYYIKILEQEGLTDFFFTEEVMPLYREVTIPMEAYGVDMDIDLMKDTLQKITKDISDNKSVVMKSLLKDPTVRQWIVDSATTKYPPSNKGSFVQALVEQEKIDLPVTASGKYSTAKKYVEALDESTIKDYLLTGDETLLTDEQIIKASVKLWKKFYKGDLVNLNSTKHLSEIIFGYMGVKPVSLTDKGQPQLSEEVIDKLSETIEWAENLRVYNKLRKIKATYIERFLNKEEDGRYYFYFKQHGTVSGRYGSDAQQFPKPLEDDEERSEIVKYYNRFIRGFFIAGTNRKVIDSDYVSLEPHVFASVSEEKEIQDIFKKGHDFYSTIAIATEKLQGVSADKNAPNFLKKVDPVKRQHSKYYCLHETTRVSTRKGYMQIKHVQEGDRVHNSYGLDKVLKVHKRSSDKVLRIHFNNSPTLMCTPEHEIMVLEPNIGFVRAEDLKAGYQLSGRNKPTHIESISTLYGNFEVYDLTMEKAHDYYANGILVHNCLGIPYGMQDFALSKLLNVPRKEAKKLIEGYLGAYPNLKRWMDDSREFVKKHGYIKNRVGRVRHLPRVKELYDRYGDGLLDWQFRKNLEMSLGVDAVKNLYRDYKNGLNNSMNFQIQSLAASIVNRSALEINRYFRKRFNLPLELLDYYPAIVQLQVHDQLIINTEQELAEELSEECRSIMENILELPGVSLKAPPEIADNFRDGH